MWKWDCFCFQIFVACLITNRSMFRELQEGKGLIVYLFAAIKIQDRGKRRWMECGEGSNFKYNISKTGFYQVRQGQDQQREGNWGSLPEAELSSQYNPVNIRNGIQQIYDGCDPWGRYWPPNHKMNVSPCQSRSAGRRSPRRWRGWIGRIGKLAEFLDLSGSWGEVKFTCWLWQAVWWWWWEVSLVGPAAGEWDGEGRPLGQSWADPDFPE